MACQIFMLLVTRVHYTIDMVSGVVYAHYIWILANKYAYIIDKRLIQKRAQGQFEEPDHDKNS